MKLSRAEAGRRGGLAYQRKKEENPSAYGFFPLVEQVPRFERIEVVRSNGNWSPELVAAVERGERIVWR